MAKRMISRKFRSIALANIIVSENLFDEWRVYCYSHPKIKSAYRLANLFLMNKGRHFLYKTPGNLDMSLNCSNLLDRYYEDYIPNDYPDGDIGSATFRELREQNGYF